MIVCLCRRVSDRDIRSHVESGVSNFELMQDQTGVASACGCCHDSAREVFAAAVLKSGAYRSGGCSVAVSPVVMHIG